MTEEIKKDETVESPEEVNTSEEIKTDVKEVDDSSETKNIENSIDYEAELKREREAREKAEKILAEKRFKESRQKRDIREEDNGELEQDDKPVTAKDLELFLARERQEMQRMSYQEKIVEYINNLANSEAEARLIKEIHQSRAFPSHLSLKEQVEEAFVIANRKKLLLERDEAIRALKNKSRVNNNPASSYHDEPQGNEPQISAADKIVIQQAGLTYNSQTRRYEKQLSNGKKLIRDNKTKRIYFE